MRQKRSLETEEQRNQRFERQAHSRIEAGAAEERALDAMVKRSIEIHGP